MKNSESRPVKPWHGRFRHDSSATLVMFSASVHFDRRLYRQDIAASIAHARTLEKAAVLTAAETTQIVRALEQIREEIEAGRFDWTIALEDIHMNIESRLIALIGDTGKKLHTGRSRNDQVATDLRLLLREVIDTLQTALGTLQKSIVALAEQHVETLLPGYTHLQAAQPISFGHHLLAWFEMLKRDRARLVDVRRRTNVLPLGSAALAGTSFALDRKHTADLLDFDGISDNSLDAVGDRDFAIEFCAACAVLMMHLSRMGEELVLWSSQPFAFVEMADAHCTGSSIMPQKKNPDGAELIRGKSGRVYGNLMALLTVMKAQPLAYNRDNQEDKEPVFDTADTAHACVRMMTTLIGGLRVDSKRMAQATVAGYTTATDLADYLVAKGLPFRDAHAVTGQLVQMAIAKKCTLADLELAAMQSVCGAINADVSPVLSERHALHARNSYGGTAPAQVRLQIQRAYAYLDTPP